VETHQLRYFLAVATTGRFTAAARICNVSQPSLSIQVAKLEAELGGALFERSRKGARLTARGESFLPHAKAVLDHMEEAHREAESLTGLSTGKVTLGCLPTTGAHVLPKVLTAFRRSHPKVQVLLREESSPGLARCLEQGEVDLAILDEAGLNPGLEHVSLLSDGLLAALPLKNPLSGKGRISLKQLASEPFILMKPDHGFRKITDDLLRKAGVEPRVVFESGEIETVQALVAAGLGVSIVPEMVRRSSGLAYAELAQPGAARTLILAWRRKAALSPGAEEMRRTIVTAMRN